MDRGRPRRPHDADAARPRRWFYAHVLKQSGRRPHRCLRHRATIGAARDYLGDARSI